MNQSKYHQTMSINKQGRDFVIGDIHGRLKKVIEAMRRVNFDESKDRLFAVGDLVDGKKDNLKVLDMLYKKEWFHSIRGNHEQLLINRYEFPGDIPCCSKEDAAKKTKWDAAELHRYNGGKWFDNLRSDTARLRIKTMLNKLPLAMTIETQYGDLGLVHAGINLKYNTWNEFLEALETSEEAREDAIWTRDVISNFYDYYRHIRWEKEVPVEYSWLDGIGATVHGHTGVEQAIAHCNSVFIDARTGSTDLIILEASEVFEMVEEQRSLMEDES